MYHNNNYNTFGHIFIFRDFDIKRTSSIYYYCYQNAGNPI